MKKSSVMLKVCLILTLSAPSLVLADTTTKERVKMAVGAVGGSSAALGAYKTGQIAWNSFKNANLTEMENSRTLIDNIVEPRAIDDALRRQMVTEMADGDNNSVRVILTETESRRVILENLEKQIQNAEGNATSYHQQAVDRSTPRPMYAKNPDGTQGHFLGMGVSADNAAEATRLNGLALEEIQRSARLQREWTRVNIGGAIELVEIQRDFARTAEADVHDFLSREAARGSRVMKIVNLPAQFAKRVSDARFKGGGYSAIAGVLGLGAAGAVYYGFFHEDSSSSSGYSPSTRSYNNSYDGRR